MKMKKKLIILCSLILALAMVMTACGGDGGQKTGGENETSPKTPSEGGSSGSTEKVEIKIATWAGSEEAGEFQEYIDQLNAASETYHIIQDSNPADYDTRLTTQLSGNAGPDLFWISAGRAAQFAPKGVMMDLTDRLAASDRPGADISDYYETSLQPFSYDGKVYCLPWIMQPVMVYVNKDMLDEAGIVIDDTKWNWNDFMDAARKLTKDRNGNSLGESGFDSDNIAQWGFTLNGWPPVQVFIWQAGGDVITEDFSSCPIDKTEAIQGFKFYHELITSGVSPSQQTIRDRGFDQMFRDGTVAMFMGGAADNLELKVAENFNCVVYELPAGPTGKKATFVDVLGMGINAKTKNPDVAFEACVDIANIIHTSGWKTMPPRKSLATLENMQKLVPARADSFPAIINSMEFGRPYRFFGNTPDWDNIFWSQLMDPVVNSGTNPEELISTVKPLLEEALKK
jgi:multiple sugar transport system substrate-binding protein